MFKQAIIYYPTNENALNQINKDIAAFRFRTAIKYIEAQTFNDCQIEALFASISIKAALKTYIK